MAHTAHVSEYKKRVVAQLSKLTSEYPIIGVVNMENMGAKQLQQIRAGLRSEVVMIMSKRNLMKHAFDASKKQGIKELEPSLMNGMPALLFTKKNPFKLAATLAKSRTPAPAKAGQIAPKDITIPAGATPFSPGPIISELAGVGIKAGIEGGKVAIKQDFLAARAGERIKPKIADLLTKLSILPMEAGLDLVAVYDNGVIFNRAVLALDQKLFLGMLGSVARESLAVAMHMDYAAAETISPLLGKAFRESLAVAESGNIITDETIKKMLGVAEHHGKHIMKKTGLPEQVRPVKSKEEIEFEEAKKRQAENARIAEKLEEDAQTKKTKDEVDKVEELYGKMLKKGTLRK